MEKIQTVFPFLDMNISESGLPILIKNGAMILGAKTILDLIQKLQDDALLKVLGKRSKKKLQKELDKQCQLILDRDYKTSSYQDIVLSLKLSGN